MAPEGETRIQLCGRLVVRLEGRRVDDALPGALGHLLERSGNVAEALRVYDHHRLTLRDELGIPPSSAAQDVNRRLLGENATTA